MKKFIRSKIDKKPSEDSVEARKAFIRGSQLIMRSLDRCKTVDEVSECIQELLDVHDSEIIDKNEPFKTAEEARKFSREKNKEAGAYGYSISIKRLPDGTKVFYPKYKVLREDTNDKDLASTGLFGKLEGKGRFGVSRLGKLRKKAMQVGGLEAKGSLTWNKFLTKKEKKKGVSGQRFTFRLGS